MNTKSPKKNNQSDETCFDHTKLDEFVKNIERAEEINPRFNSYRLLGTTGSIADFTWLKKHELRICIDNFPGQRLYYQTNFPIHTFDEFIREMKRINLNMELK